MNLAIRCNKCGNWQSKETQDVNKAVLNCFRCGNKKRIRSAKGWNVNYFILNENIHSPEVIQKLNGGVK